MTAAHLRCDLNRFAVLLGDNCERLFASDQQQ